jgi:hypothetical protein
MAECGKEIASTKSGKDKSNEVLHLWHEQLAHELLLDPAYKLNVIDDEDDPIVAYHRRFFDKVRTVAYPCVRVG